MTYDLNRMSSGKPVPRVIWIAGPTGCGKTRYDIENSVGVPWISGANLTWFDGYCGQKTAILDDFRKEACPFAFFLRVLDRYALQTPVKGGFTWWNPEIIFVTCPRVPQDEFVRHGPEGSTAFEDVEQVTRRCDEIMVWNYTLK